MLNQCIKLIRLENIVIFLISIFTIFRYQGLIAPYLHSKFYDNNSSLNGCVFTRFRNPKLLNRFVEVMSAKSGGIYHGFVLEGDARIPPLRSVRPIDNANVFHVVVHACTLDRILS